MITWGPKDPYRYISLDVGWLIFSISFAFHRPYAFVYDANNEIIGHNYYPHYRIDVIEVKD